MTRTVLLFRVKVPLILSALLDPAYSPRTGCSQRVASAATPTIPLSNVKSSHVNCQSLMTGGQTRVALASGINSSRTTMKRSENQSLRDRPESVVSITPLEASSLFQILTDTAAATILEDLFLRDRKGALPRQAAQRGGSGEQKVSRTQSVCDTVLVRVVLRSRVCKV